MHGGGGMANRDNISLTSGDFLGGHWTDVGVTRESVGIEWTSRKNSFRAASTRLAENSVVPPRDRGWHGSSSRMSKRSLRMSRPRDLRCRRRCLSVYRWEKHGAWLRYIPEEKLFVHLCHRCAVNAWRWGDREEERRRERARQIPGPAGGS